MQRCMSQNTCLYASCDSTVPVSYTHLEVYKRQEVFLSQQTERHGFLYRVEGRADGVITDAVGVTVDEIKTTGAPLTMITEDFNRAHWGQAMCYAYFYCLQENLERISVQLLSLIHI